MAEIAAPLPRERASSRLLRLLVLAAASAAVAAALLLLVQRPKPAEPAAAVSGPQAHAHPRHHEPLELTRLPRDAAAVRAAGQQAAFEARLGRLAGRGLDRGIFTSSPGGVVATAARVARWKPLIVRAARGTGVSPNVLEAMVFVESSGYRDAVAGRRAGLLQMTPWQARSLGLRVDRVSRRARLLAAVRERVDERRRALPALRATALYLRDAGRRLGRADLAVASYRLGVRNLAAATAGKHVPFASLYFGSAPDRKRGIWFRLSREGPAARDYYWKVLAAQRVLRLYRHEPAALAYEIRQQAKKRSAEELLHPRSRTPRFTRPRDLARAWKRRDLLVVPHRPGATHIAFARSFGEIAPRLGRSKRLYMGLRPEALDVLLHIGRRVHELSGARRPLILTSAVRDDIYQRRLTSVNANAARSYSIHTTGYAFDIARSYASPRQARAFQFVLERLEALNAIAYIREAAAIHIAVSADVTPALLRRAS